MRRLHTLGIAALLVLAACSSQTAEQDAGTPDETALAEVDGPDGQRAAGEASGTGPGAALPPAGIDRRYVGRWAARADLCESGAWTFARDRLVTAGEVSCQFTQVTEAPGGYDIAARCTAQGLPRDDRFRLRFAESARAMLVEGSSVVSDVGLVYCGPA